MKMTQTPAPEDFILKWRGDTLKVELRLETLRKGRAALRTNIGHVGVRRAEIIAETERGETPLARAWTDWPLKETEPGVFTAELPLEEVGVFSAKACFFPEGSHVPEWPEGRNFHVKVGSSEARASNAIYTVFPRQFGSFRAVARRLGTIMDEMGFRIIQTLPPFPVPTTYAVMGEYGCPFAALDFLSVDPAMAEFDEAATPLDQFRELIDAVHARGGRFFVDLPANHTGWASTLQTHHPEWFRREQDGRFHSPGAWGVVWSDLVELDYANAQLRAYMADVFLFWCRNGVDGFRCDAGYMIPLKTWEYIVARVRDEFPDTVFMLEGLGGKLETTDALLAEANLDWAYSEIFQTYDRRQFEWYLPGAIARSERYGTLVHFAETHDNDRLAKGGEVYARLRVQLAALLSWQGAWGIANGVEWYCREKIDVHGKNDLNWGAADNMVALIGRLNRILATFPAFQERNHLELVTEGGGNTLAVVRDGLLVVANLDTANGVTAHFNRAKFGVERACDLITKRMVETRDGAVALQPGEVLCLFPAPGAETSDAAVAANDPWVIKNATHKSDFVLRPSLVHWTYPRDLKRVVCVPEGQWVTVAAPYRFRMQLVDPESGKTLRAINSRTVEPSRHLARFMAPAYKGDGTVTRRLVLELVVFEPDRARRVASDILIPPNADTAAVRLAHSGETVRLHPEYRTVLSNGAGAMSQMRLGWGSVASQYDAILAANPNPNVPSDRLTLWTRMRGWLQREGYARELDAKCVVGVKADPAGRGAQWHFHVPCGMGQTADFELTVTLAENANAARVRVTRIPGPKTDVGDSVRLVFRPDLEWRSFHATTKAYQGAEGRFAAASTPIGDSAVAFAPYEGAFVLGVMNGVYHHEPQWTYGVAHPEEAARGQDGSGDLYSPGWISVDLAVGAEARVAGFYFRPGETVEPYPETVRWGAEQLPAVGTVPFDEAMRRALDLYIVRRDDLKTVIAGYPWFLDWGRDTFIFLRGMIAAGRLADSVKILRAFAAFEECGTLPNIIYGGKAGNRDTTDAPLWFIRCVREVEGGIGGIGERGGRGAELLRRACESIVDNYIKGTPNGIRVDPASGLVWSPSHFTWMDTNYPACTPRVGYPVEIQALWISALDYLGRTELAAKARKSLEKYFKAPVGYYDCLAAPDGEPAARAKPEDTVRPNQLFLITLGVTDDASILDAVEELLVPGGIRSLNAGHPSYRGVYAGDEDTSRKPAYHNGTVWAWPFPLYAEALVLTGRASRPVALAMLATAVESANSGCLCHVSEIADGDAPHAQKGCTAQAWSDSELLRVWLALAETDRKEG